MERATTVFNTRLRESRSGSLRRRNIELPFPAPSSPLWARSTVPPTRLPRYEYLKEEEYWDRGTREHFKIKTEWGKEYLDSDEADMGIHISDIHTYAFWQA